MHEYHKRWSAFVAFSIKMDEALRPITETMNKIYEELYPDYPVNPMFSIYRFTT